MLHAELEKLPARYKGPLVLCYLQGKTHDEAAAELGWTIAVFRGPPRAGAEQAPRRSDSSWDRVRRGSFMGLLLEGRPELPVTFVVKTAQAAVTTAREAVARGLISSTASHLAQEVIRSMSYTFLKIAGAFVLAVMLTAGGLLAIALRRPHGRPSSPRPKRCRRWGPRIPWRESWSLGGANSPGSRRAAPETAALDR